MNSNGYSRRPPEMRLDSEIIQASKAIRDSVRDSLDGMLTNRLHDFNTHLEKSKVSIGAGLSKQLRNEFSSDMEAFRKEVLSKIEESHSNLSKSLLREVHDAVAKSYQDLLGIIRELISSIPPPTISVGVPELRQPNIQVNVPELRQPSIHVNVPKLDQPNIQVNVPELKQPEIRVENNPNITVPEIKVPDITVPEVKIPEITVNVPKLDQPGIQVNVPASQVDVHVPPPRRFRKQITYDELGRPTEIVEIEEQ